MKIALITSSYHPYNKGGGEYSVKELAENLASKGQEVFVITAFHKNKIEYVGGIKVYRVKHPNIYWSYTSGQQSSLKKLLWHTIESYNWRVKKAISPILKEELPDVVHIRNSEDFSAYACKVVRELGIPNLVSLNSYTWLCPKASMFKHGHNCKHQCIDCKLITAPKKFLSRHVDMVAGASQFTLDAHIQRGYFPHADKQIVYTSTEEKPLPLPYLNQEQLTLGYIGRIHPTKGVDKIITSFLSLDTRQHTKLLIAGDGPDDYVQRCQALAEGHHTIEFLGKVEAEHFYKQVDIVIISSLWHEPFPRVLIESYAYGRPVLTTTTGGTAEMVEPSKTGILFDPYASDQLAKKMSLIVQLSKEQILDMHKAVKTFFTEKFQDSTQKYLDLYKQLLANKK